MVSCVQFYAYSPQLSYETTISLLDSVCATGGFTTHQYGCKPSLFRRAQKGDGSPGDVFAEQSSNTNTLR